MPLEPKSDSVKRGVGSFILMEPLTLLEMEWEQS